MAYLPLSQGYFALIDDEDLPRLQKFRWHIACFRKNAIPYAIRYYPDPAHKSKNRKLEYEVLNIRQPIRKGFCVDHINRNPLDCRKKNLRVCTIQQNNFNKAVRKIKKSSIYKGVFFNKKNSRWLASIKCDYKSHRLGLFKNEYHAMHAYNAAAVERHGRFACLNRWQGPSPGHPDPFTKNIYARLQKFFPDLKIPTGPYHARSQSPSKPLGVQLLLPFD
jgi:hypothetical protein